MRSGISTPHISSIERGLRHPSLEYAQRIASALGVPLHALCDSTREFVAPRIRNSTEELPWDMQNFILNEAAYPYLEAAQQMSKLSEEDTSLLKMLIDLLSERHRLQAGDML